MIQSFTSPISASSSHSCQWPHRQPVAANPRAQTGLVSGYRRPLHRHYPIVAGATPNPPANDLRLYLHYPLLTPAANLGTAQSATHPTILPTSFAASSIAIAQQNTISLSLQLAANFRPSRVGLAVSSTSYLGRLRSAHDLRDTPPTPQYAPNHIPYRSANIKAAASARHDVVDAFPLAASAEDLQ